LFAHTLDLSDNARLRAACANRCARQFARTATAEVKLADENLEFDGAS
jgi:hypothetical protein